MAIDVGGALIDEPLDIVTGRSRSQVSNSRTLQITTTPTGSRANHTLSFGGTFRRTKWFFGRNDLLAGPAHGAVGDAGRREFHDDSGGEQAAHLLGGG